MSNHALNGDDGAYLPEEYMHLCFALSFRSATLLGLSKGLRPHLFLYFISYILSMCQYTTQSDKDEEVNYIKQKYVYN